MSFLAPAAFIFALALPVVVVFYLLKRKRVVKLISSTVLWQRYLAETQANAPFQRLRRNWLLVLQLLMLALAVFALSRPYFRGGTSATRLRVLILDGSASMQASDEKPSRFEKARAEALRWVDGLRDGEQMMLLLAAASTEVRQSPTTDKAALRRALNACQPSDAPTRLADALKTAGAFTFEQRGEATVTSGEIHLFSDGAAPDLDEFSNRNLPLIYHRIGVRGENVGLVRIDARGHPENPAERAVFASVANFSTNSASVDLELKLDGELVSTRTVTLGPTNSDLVIFTAPQKTNGVFTVRVTTPDDLSVDNEASVISLLPQPARVLLVSRGNRFLEKALRGAPQARVTTVSQLTDGAAEYDVVVLDDVLPVVWPQVSVLALHVAPTNLFPSWRAEPTPPIVDWKSSHPLLRFVGFDNVQVGETVGVVAPSWGVPLVESPKTPLIVAGELNRQKIVWVGFDPLQSTWPLRVSFPIFMANVVDWLGPGGRTADQLMVRPGTAFRWPLGAGGAATLNVISPDGRSQSRPLERDTREVVIADTARQGIYRVEAGTNQLMFVANLMDGQESNIRPRDELSVGKYASVPAASVRQANAEVWRWLLLAGLVVLLFEWWYYHRRTA